MLQIKFLKDVKKGKMLTKNHSCGVAFVEFSEHEHALVALRVLNNNPGSKFTNLIILNVMRQPLKENSGSLNIGTTI